MFYFYLLLLSVVFHLSVSALSLTPQQTDNGVAFLNDLVQQYYTGGTSEQLTPLKDIKRGEPKMIIKTRVGLILAVLEQTYKNDPLAMVTSPEYSSYFSRDRSVTVTSLNEFRKKMDIMF